MVPCDRPATMSLGESYLYRISEGRRLARLPPQPCLVTFGGTAEEGSITAELMAGAILFRK